MVHSGCEATAFGQQRVPLKAVKTCPLIQPALLPCTHCRHNTTAGPSATTSPSLLLLSALASRSYSPLPCTGSPRYCLPCCSFSCRAGAGAISPRSAGAPSLRSSLPGSLSRWSVATRRTLCRCSSEPSSAWTTRRTALRCGECHQCVVSTY